MINVNVLAFDAVKTDIIKAMKNEKKFIKNELFQNLGLNCNNIDNKLPEQFQSILLRFSREFNHTRFDRKVIKSF